jgi:predicted DNA-binding transcriptional regulator AlpA
MIGRQLDVKGVAEKLGICRATVYNLVKNNPDFPSQRKINRAARWDEGEIDAFLEKCPRGAYGERER